MSQDPGHSSLTDCGLPGIKDIPFGVHMCHFYDRCEDLAAALVPYFAAGLRNSAASGSPPNRCSRRMPSSSCAGRA